VVPLPTFSAPRSPAVLHAAPCIFASGCGSPFGGVRANAQAARKVPIDPPGFDEIPGRFSEGWLSPKVRPVGDVVKRLRAQKVGD